MNEEKGRREEKTTIESSVVLGHHLVECVAWCVTMTYAHISFAESL